MLANPAGRASRPMADTHDVLASLVERAKCKPGWTFRLAREDDALRLVITVAGYDSSKPEGGLIPFTVSHYFPVPTATYNEPTWRRWIFDRCRGVENHELGEWFRIGAERPFQPLPRPGEHPSTV